MMMIMTYLVKEELQARAWPRQARYSALRWKRHSLIIFIVGIIIIKIIIIMTILLFWVMSRPGPQPSTSWHSSGNLQAQALSATAGHHHGATLQDSNSSILAPDNEFTVYIGESHFFTGCASRNRLSAGIAA